MSNMQAKSAYVSVAWRYAEAFLQGSVCPRIVLDRWMEKRSSSNDMQGARKNRGALEGGKLIRMFVDP